MTYYCLFSTVLKHFKLLVLFSPKIMIMVFLQPCVEASFRKMTNRKSRQDSLRQSISTLEDGSPISSDDQKYLLDDEEIFS